MSYTTRCPACGTMFRVVPDQLKISDGWVRCGHCADVFDATLYLEAWTSPSAAVVSPTAPVRPPVSAQPPAPVPPSEPEPAFVATQTDALVQDTEPAPITDPVPAPLHPPVDRDQAAPRASQGMVADRAEDADEPVRANPPGDIDGASMVPPGGAWPDPVVADSASAALVDDRASTPAEEPVATDDFRAELSRFATAAGRTEPEVPAAPVAPRAPVEVQPPPAFLEPEDVLAVHEAGEPGFMRQARRQAFWRSPAVRAVQLLAMLVLGLGLLLQWALHERDTLAARHPALAPLLARVCEPLGCEVGAVQRIDAVLIDSSTLVRRLGNFYAFEVVLKNTADLPVAVPALELSLTDTRDSVVARRVFLPPELPGAPAVLLPGSTQALSLRLSIADVGGVPMAGYRALVFYP